MTDEILILAIVMILGAVIFVVVFGVVPQIPKGAYITADVSLKQMPGYSAIAIRHRGGDVLNFSGSTETSFPVSIYVDTPGGSFRAVPGPAIGEFRPGNTVYLYHTGTGYNLVSSLIGVAALPQLSEDLRVRIVDPVSGLMILEWKSPKFGTTATKTVVPISTVSTTITTTLTKNVTPTATVTTFAPVTTSIPSGPVISVSWSPPGLGTISPPGVTPGTVVVPDGASQTFTFTPKSMKSVLSISLDGSPVSFGGSVGQTTTYTLSNVHGAHTLTATFG
ncbi:type IV pilin [Methanoregula sp.]|uniref:type IV pilin n=1 Tax=Methanoregula sp. TaxID=2052170 RepID=UPI0035658420